MNELFQGFGFAIGTFFALFILVPIFLAVVRIFGLYAIVNEGTCHVYTLFGKVVGILKEPGFYFLPFQLGLSAFVITFLGERRVLDMRLDQQYLRSQPVNSEEGAPMGVGIWYEMYISDPVSYLFKNADPQGSLAAINTAHNQVSSDISLAQASADQKIVQSRRAVEIETLNAQAEVEPLVALAEQLVALKQSGPDALKAYLRNVRLKLFGDAQRVILEVKQ